MLTLFLNIYLLILGISFISSLFSFRLDYPFHLKLFSVLLGYTVLVEGSVNYLTQFLPNKSNSPQYNCFMLVEFCWYAFYYKQLVKSAFIKKAINLFFYAFPVFWYFSVFFLFGINHWNSYVFVVGGFFTIVWSISYCYQLFTSEDLIKLSVCSEFWIAIGLLLFYACEVPYMGMFYYLATNFEVFAVKLKIVLQIIDAIMYLLFTYAFLCRINFKKL